MILGDSFRHFEEDLKVNSEQVKETIKCPSQYQELHNGVRLYLKSFKDKKLCNLLIGTQDVNQETIFTFGYWIPSELISTNYTLTELLELFAHKFGLMVCIENEESLFFIGIKTTIYGRLESPFQIITILGNENIPCDLILSFNETFTNNFNQIDVNYCFAVNNNRYLTWLNSVETISIKIPNKWYKQLNEITDLLDPNGNTKLKILKSTRTESTIEVSDENSTDLEIPKVYSKQFGYISDILNGSEPPDKIVIIPEFQRCKCVFCGSDEISSEHIFPKWIRSYFTEKLVASTLHTQARGESLLESYKSKITGHRESSYGYTTNRVCITCNTGWMSRLEDQVKSIMVDDENKLTNSVDLLLENEEIKYCISKWLLVKSLLLLVKSNIPIEIPSNTFSEIMNGKIPLGFIFEVIEDDGYNLDFIARKGIIDDRQISLKRMEFNLARSLSYRLLFVIIHFGNFIFRVSYLDPSFGLQRISYIKKMRSIYPFQADLKHHDTKDEAKKWLEIPSKLRIHILSGGFILSESE